MCGCCLKTTTNSLFEIIRKNIEKQPIYCINIFLQTTRGAYSGIAYEKLCYRTMGGGGKEQEWEGG